MGELVPSPVVVTAAIVGFGKDDRVLELIEYPEADVRIGPSGRPSVTRVGLTHVGMVCDDLGATRALLESRGVEFLTDGNRRGGRSENDVVPRPVGDGHHPHGEGHDRQPLLGTVDAK